MSCFTVPGVSRYLNVHANIKLTNRFFLGNAGISRCAKNNLIWYLSKWKHYPSKIRNRFWKLEQAFGVITVVVVTRGMCRTHVARHWLVLDVLLLVLRGIPIDLFNSHLVLIFFDSPHQFNCEDKKDCALGLSLSSEISLRALSRLVRLFAAP